MEEQLHNLQQELRNTKGETSEAQQELEDIEWEIYNANETEKSQRRNNLEQTKMSLNQSTENSEESSVHGKGPSSFDVIQSRDEIGTLRAELKLAWQAEERNKRAMNELASELEEVTREKNVARRKLSETQLEMERMRDELDELKAQLDSTEAKLRRSIEESRTLKLEAQVSILAWREKENGFIDCMRLCEDDVIKLKKENDRLNDSQMSAKEEISRLRDILRQAIGEANDVKQALETSREENSLLKDAVREKEKANQRIKQELEGVKIREANALERAKELQGSNSSAEFSRNASYDPGTYTSPYRSPLPPPRATKTMEKFPSENWSRAAFASTERRRSVGESYGGSSVFDVFVSPDRKKDRGVVQKSKKNIWGRMSFKEKDSKERQFEGFDNVGDTPNRMKKKMQILRKFGELLRKRSFSNN